MINGRLLIHNLVPLIRNIRSKLRRKPDHYQKYVIVTLLSAVTLVFGATISFDFVTWDDPQLVTNNVAVQNFSFQSLKTIFTTYDPELYVPLTLLSYQLEHLLFGLHPFIYHLTNVLLHACNSLLVFWVVLLFFKKRNVAFATALLFAVHPIQVEAVAWVSARKDLLSATFFLAALGYYLRREPRFFVVSIVCFFAALLSKVSVAFLPVILLFIDWREQKIQWQRLLPYFLLSGIFIIIALNGKESNIAALSLIDRSLLAAQSTFFYIWKIVFPHNLSLFYPATLPISFIYTVALLGCIAIGFLCRKKYPSLVTGCVFYMVMLVPSFASFSRRGELYVASDRYVYLASIGLFFVFSILLFRFQKRIPYILLIICACIAGLLSFERSFVWANSHSLYRSVLETHPDSHIAYGNLGLLEMDKGNIDQAIDYYRKAISLDSSFDHAYMNLGIALAQQEKYPEAIEALESAAALNSNLPKVHSNLGVVYELSGNNVQAIDSFLRELQRGESIPVHQSLSRLYAEEGKTREGLHHLLRSLQLDPATQKEAEELEAKIQSAT